VSATSLNGFSNMNHVLELVKILKTLKAMLMLHKMNCCDITATFHQIEG
jgi:hypothetical protein